jgi:hypothetical protein
MLFPDSGNYARFALLLANLSAITFDFVARHKTGGTHMNYFIFKQLPVLPPDRYTESDLAFIVPRVLELTYTAHDLTGWAQDLGYDGPPFPFDPARRATLRAELDAHYARLYGLTRDELRYILDPADIMGADYPSETFRVLKDKEMREFGEYRTQRLVLREFNRMALANANGETYISLLNPPPGIQAAPSYSAHGIIRDAADACLVGLILTIIRQAERLPRHELIQALMLASHPNYESFVNEQDIQLLHSFAQSHFGVFDSGRLAGDRIHRWLRHLESTGVIRLDGQEDMVVPILTAAMPSYVISDAETAQVATILIQATAHASARITRSDEEQAAAPTTKRA